EMSLAFQKMVTLYVVKQRLKMKAGRDLQICNDHELKIIGIGSIMVKMHDGTMDGNAIANLHLALADGVLSSIKEKKSAKEI
nr:Gag-Pol polyprotein [Tanacetum cinerariifolium]